MAVIRWCGAAVGLLLMGCSSPRPPDEPMGALPSAVTTASPLWIPFRPRAGRSIPRTGTERATFTEVRRLTQGQGEHRWPRLFADGSKVLVVRGEPASCASLIELDLESGRERSHAVDGCPDRAFYQPRGGGLWAMGRLKGDAGPSKCDESDLAVGVPVPAGACSLFRSTAGDGLAPWGTERLFWGLALEASSILFIKVSPASDPTAGDGPGVPAKYAIHRLSGTAAETAAADDIVYESDSFIGGLAVGPHRDVAWHEAITEQRDRFRLNFAGTDASAPRPLPTPGVSARDPSPVGPKRWIYTGLESGAPDLYLVSPHGPLDGTGRAQAVQLTDHPGYDGQAAGSSDGRSIVFISDRGGTRDLFWARLSEAVESGP